MGGAKKKSTNQIGKAKGSGDSKPSKKSAKPVVEKKTLNVGLPDIENKTLVPELEKMKAITPSTVASSYGVRVSIAKDFLKELAKKQLIDLVESNNRIKIYKLIATQQKS